MALDLMRNVGTLDLMGWYRPCTRTDTFETMSHALTALVIDDSKPAITAHCAMLKKLGYDVMACTNGKEGFDLLLERRFTVVLCDIEMPNMDGLEMIRRLRKLEADTPVDTPQVVICVSGRCGHNDNDAEALEAGMDMFVRKPLKLSALSEMLAECVK